jgi:glutathione S-transferase
MLTLYDYLDSGNGYKIRLLLHQLERPFRLVLRDILAGETRTPEYLAKNPNGRIPLVETDDGRFLAESNAILFWLAEGTRYFPTDPWERAQTMQWLFFEQYSHEPNVATVRFWLRHDRPHDPKVLEAKRVAGHAALGVMESHLSARTYFVGGAYGIADIALYAYTHVAPQGGFDLDRYPAIRAWMERVAAEPRHVPITFAGGT